MMAGNIAAAKPAAVSMAVTDAKQRVVMKFIKEKSFGILLCAAVAAFSMFLSSLSAGSFSLEVIGAPVFSIIIGMIITLIFPSLASCGAAGAGIKFTSKKFSSGQ